MEEKEIELFDYINVLVKRKWLIVIGTLICTLAAVAFNIVRKPPPPTYEARASLLIIPPVFRTELTLPQFSMGVYQALAKAQDLEQAIIDTLQLTDRAGNSLSVSALNPMLKTEIVSRLGASRQGDSARQEGSGASLLELIVRSSTASRMPLVQIANTWGELFVLKNSGFSSQEAMGSYEFINEQYKTSRRNLHASENALNAFNRRTNAAAHQKELAAKEPKFSEYQTAYVNTALDLSSEVQTLNDLQKQLDAMENAEGIWVGSFDVFGTGGINRGALNEDQRQILDAVVQTRDRIQTLQEQIRVFRDSANPEFWKKDLEEKWATLVSYIKQFSRIKIESASTEQALKENKGLTGTKGIIPLQVSSIPTDMLREIMSLQAGYNFFRPRHKHLQQEMVRLRAEIDSLEKINYEKQLELDPLTDHLALLKDIYQTLAADYTSAKKQANSLKLSINALRPRVFYYREKLSQLRRETKVLTEDIADLEVERTRLTGDIQTYKSTFDRFSKLLEEARVTKASEPSDVKVVARAVGAVLIPPVPQRSVVLLAAAVGLMVSVFLAFLLGYLEKSKERLAQEKT